jgi:site-specific DNA-methyltransferase (adenine-specific)
LTAKLYLGDCLDVMARLPDASVDMVLCDLPYGTTDNEWDSVIAFDALWRQYRRVCRGAVVLTAAQPFTTALIASNLRDFRYCWVWEKTRSVGFLLAKKQPMRKHEDIAVFSMGRHPYNPQGLVRKPVPTIRKGRNNGANYRSSERDCVQEFENYPKSILRVSSEATPLHPTQKPVALMEYLVRTYTNAGDTVLDNCMGSGTTGVACANAGRVFIGIERDASYLAIARRRIAAAQREAIAERRINGRLAA